MTDVRILPLTVELTGSFFRSAQDALERARRASETTPTERDGGPQVVSAFTHRRLETQAAVEAVVFSFLTVEAAINYCFFLESDAGRSGPLTTWFKQQWKRGLPIYDRFVLLLGEYARVEVVRLPYFTALFKEFVGFRNRLVHAHPDHYDALVEPGPSSSEVYVHDVELLSGSRVFAASQFSTEIGNICAGDAGRAFEIMLLVLALVDKSFGGVFPLPTHSQGTIRFSNAETMLRALNGRYYPRLEKQLC